MTRPSGLLRGRAARAQAFDESLRSTPLAMVDVYVDDFLLAAQTKREQIRSPQHPPLHRFRLPATGASRPQHSQGPASIKKMHQGDAHWAYRKQMLSWVIPPPPYTSLCALSTTCGRRAVGMAISHGIVLPARAALQLAEAIPGSNWFVLDPAGHSCAPTNTVSVSPCSVCTPDCASDFRLLADSLRSRPTHFRELVPSSAF
jgi:hypothetical protein